MPFIPHLSGQGLDLTAFWPVVPYLALAWLIASALFGLLLGKVFAVGSRAEPGDNRGDQLADAEGFRGGRLDTVPSLRTRSFIPSHAERSN